MATYNDTYSNLISLISATTGITVSANSKDLTKVNSLINLAARRAYDASDYWERFLVIGEPRTVTRGIVQASEDSFNVYGAGTDEVNGLYQRNGTVNNVAAYTLYDTDGTTELYSLVSDGVGEDGRLVEGDPNTSNVILYEAGLGGTSANEYPTSGWSVQDGDAPAPLLVDVADMAYPLYWQKFDPSSYESRSYEFQIDANGIKPYGGYPEDESIIYVTYRKRLTDTYGDGTGATTSTIPSEWFNYMALYTMYMLQQGNRQSNPSQSYALALSEVNRSLEDEMMKQEASGVANTVRQHVETRIAYSNIL